MKALLAVFLFSIAMVHGQSMEINIASAISDASAQSNGFYDDGSYPHTGELSIDGDTTTYWAGLQSVSPQVITVTFNQSYSINKILLNEKYNAFSTFGTVEYHNGTSWVELFGYTKNYPDSLFSFSEVDASAIRVTINESSAPSSWYNQVACLQELEIYHSTVPKAYYAFSGNAEDGSGNGYHGSIHGTVLSTADQWGQNGEAYDFDGQTGYLDLGDEVGDDIRTISLWISPSSTINNQLQARQVIIGRNSLSQNGEFNLSFFGASSYYAELGKLMFTRQVGSTHYSIYSNGNEWLASEWYHIVGTIHPTHGMRLYVNGVLQDETHSTIEATAVRSEGTSIGRFGDTDVRYYDGAIDEVWISAEGITQAHVNSLLLDYHIAVSIPTVSGVVGGDILLPIQADIGGDGTYRSVELTVSGFTEGMSINGVSTIGTLLEGQEWSIEYNLINSVLEIAGAGATEISGNGPLLGLELTVAGDACSSIPMNLDYAKFNSTTVEDLQSGMIQILAVPDFGDVDQNGTIEALDASEAMLHVLDDTYLDCQGIANTDVYQDGVIDLMDASMILRYLVELESELPVQPQEEFLASGQLETSDQEAIPQGALYIPFEISNGENIYSFEAEINYDPQVLTIEESEPVYFSTLLDGFMKIVSVDAELGLIRIIGAGAHPDGQAGEFMSLNFAVNENVGVGGGTEVVLNYMKFNSNHIIQDISAYVDVVLSVDDPEVPDQFLVNQNYPNPFNPSTTIRYGLPEDSNVSLVIYDVRGQVVQTISSEYQSAGWYDAMWNGESADGKTISTGIYFARLVAGDYSQVIKMLYLK